VNINRQIAQHHVRIRTMQRAAVLGGIVLACLLTLTVCSFLFQWSGGVKALLIILCIVNLLQAPAPYTRIQGHRRKLRELEAQQEDGVHV